MAILGPDWGSWEVVEHDIRMAREFGLVSSSHTRRREDCVVKDGYARMLKAGLLGPDHNLVHGTSYDDHDLRVVVDRARRSPRPCLSSCITTSAIRRSRRSASTGGMPSLGIDVELYTLRPDVPRDAGGAAVRARQGDAQQRQRGNSPFKTMPVQIARSAEMGDVGGARAILLDDKIGTLAPGKKADIVMLRADDMNMAPVYDPIYSIVEIAGAGNVDTVIIDGVTRKKDGKLTFPDRRAAQAPRRVAGVRRAHHARGQLSRGDRAELNEGRRRMSATITRRSAIAGLSALGMAPALAQSGRPEGTVTIVHGFTPGGNVDLTARLIAERLGEKLGQPIVVEPKPGAGGSTAAAAVSRAAPDGRTLFLAAGGHAVSAAIYNKLPYDALADFSWISMLSDFPFVFVTYPEYPAKTLAEFIALAKAQDGKLLCAHPGNGTGQHLALELFAAMAGIKVQGVSVSRLAAGRDRPARQARRHLHGQHDGGGRDGARRAAACARHHWSLALLRAAGRADLRGAGRVGLRSNVLARACRPRGHCSADARAVQHGGRGDPEGTGNDRPSEEDRRRGAADDVGSLPCARRLRHREMDQGRRRRRDSADLSRTSVDCGSA